MGFAQRNIRKRKHHPTSKRTTILRRLKTAQGFQSEDMFNITASLRSTRDKREYIADSGASRHMIGKCNCTSRELQARRKMKEPIDTQTTNKVVTITEEVSVYVTMLDLFLWARLLQHAPAVLALGLLVDEENYDF